MNRAIAYAEDTIGVHKLWTEVQELQSQLNSLYQTLAGFTAETRNLDHQADERKNELLIKESRENAEMSSAGFDRHMKVALAGDELLISIARAKVDAMARRDGVEASIKSVERNSNGHIARLKQLGGYFEFLAVTKAVQLSVVASMQKASESPW